LAKQGSGLLKQKVHKKKKEARKTKRGGAENPKYVTNPPRTETTARERGRQDS